MLSTLAIPLLKPAGGGAYVAKAVNFDGNTYLSCDALSCVENGLFSFVYWQNVTSYTSGANSVLFVVDPVNNYNTWETASPTNQAYEFAFAAANNSPLIHGYSGDGSNVLNEWIGFVGSVKTDLASGQKIYKAYKSIGGVVSDANVEIGSDAGNSFLIQINGLPFFFGGDSFGDNVVGAFADIRFFPGVSFLDGGVDIPTSIRNLFFNAQGKPVDPAVATAALGTPGAVLFSGNATGFATNQGVGGVFTLTGSLTNASSSPSD